MQLAKGRKESRWRRVDWEPQVVFSRERSWEVKKAREVLRLPVRMMSMNGGDDPQKMRVRGESYCETFGRTE